MNFPVMGSLRPDSRKAFLNRPCTFQVNQLVEVRGSKG
jgi:hypothetical protein